MRSIFLHAFRRDARERRRVGATLARKAKCEAFSCMSSDDMPGSGGEWAQPWRGRQNAEHFLACLPTTCPGAEASGRNLEEEGCVCHRFM